MLNSMYNINSSNNKFIITRGTTDTTYTIPTGNYSVKTFLANLQGLVNDPHITIAYNTVQNTYTFLKNGTAQLYYHGKTKCISYFYSNIDNLISTNRQFLSDIIFFKTKSDVEPFKVLKYNNEDGGNSFVYTISDKQVNAVSLKRYCI